MAWTEELPSGKYRGGYRNAQGRKRYTQPYDLKRQALAEAKTLEGEPDVTTTSTPHEGDMLTWGEWVPEWRKRRRLVEDNTKIQDEYRIENHLKSRWWDTPLDKITSSEVQAWVNMLTVEKKLAPSTVQKCKAVLSSTLKSAADCRVSCRQGHCEQLACYGVLRRRQFTQAQQEVGLAHAWLVDLFFFAHACSVGGACATWQLESKLQSCNSMCVLTWGYVFLLVSSVATMLA